MKRDHDTATRSMAASTTTMAAFAATTMLDLAVAPMVIAAPPGIGVRTLAESLSRSIGQAFIEVRCSNVHETEWKALLDQSLKGAGPAFILFDDALSGGYEPIVEMMKYVAVVATAPVVVALHVTATDEDNALDAVFACTDIHRAHVPTARLSMTEEVRQPVLLVGQVELTSSKSGELHMKIHVSDPYEHVVEFTINAIEGQDADAMHVTLEDVFSAENAAVRLEQTNLGLVCTTNDLVAS